MRGRWRAERGAEEGGHAYVDPYPEAFARLSDLATHGTLVAQAVTDPIFKAELLAYYARVSTTLARLGEMAAKERAGTSFSADDLAFINQAVVVQASCGKPPTSIGWFPDLYLDAREGTQTDPIIADVHTQPTNEGGAVVGKVLHVATSGPRMMVVTVDTCEGPRAYAGLASSYHEHVTTNFQRMTDQTWAPIATAATGPPDVPWLAPVLSQ